MSARERINGLTRYGVGGSDALEEFPNGEALMRDEVLAAIDEPWQDERPTATGDYYVSIAPEQRRSLQAVIACEVADWAVDMDGLGTGLRVRYLSGGMWLPFIDNPFFDGSKWQRRTTPADPFAKEKVQP